MSSFISAAVSFGGVSTFDTEESVEASSTTIYASVRCSDLEGDRCTSRGVGMGLVVDSVIGVVWESADWYGRYP